VGNLNPWFEEAVKRAEQRRRTPQGLQLIVRVRPQDQEAVASELRRMGIRVLNTAVPGYILVDVPDASYAEAIARLPGVEVVSYNAPVWNMAYGIDHYARLQAASRDPLLSALSQDDLEAMGVSFRPTAFMPSPLAALAPRIPRYTAQGAPVPLCQEVSWTTVTETRKIVEVPDGAVTRVKVAVIDSGIESHPAFARPANQVPMVPDMPWDTLGHGTWVATAAFGTAAYSAYGKFVPVAPVADASDFVMYKVFTAMGFTDTYTILHAMTLAAQWGARVVNMSLGGPLQGPVDQDPTSSLVCELNSKYGTDFVVAAGNSGPDEWTVASPGASPCALTIAALDPSTMEPADYSSRGPQGAWYRDHTSDFEEDLAKYGDDFLKPDAIAPGGGTHYQVVAGDAFWYDAFMNCVPQGFAPMCGTSMATPHAAAVVAAAGAPPVSSIKAALASAYGGSKDVAGGYGLIKYPLLITR
jgi:subtilisin family serine protease